MSVYDVDKAIDRVERYMRTDASSDVEALFRKTTDGWSDKPRWERDFKRTGRSLEANIYTTDEIYTLVNLGSPPHTIRPRKAGGLLRFQEGYRSATKPRFIGSQAKRRFGNWREQTVVNHPGFDAREFDKAIAKRYKPTFIKGIEKSLEP